MRFLIFSFFAFLGFLGTGGVVGATVWLFGRLFGRRIQPSHLSWAVGWITGFFFVGAVVFLYNLVTVVSDPGQGWNWAEGFVGLILILRGRAYVRRSFTKRIPADPPYRGLVTIWGRYTHVVKREGKPFLAPYWPFNIDIILVKIARYNLDKDFTELSTREAGVTVAGKWSIVYSPALGWRGLQNFLRNEKQKGVDNQLTDAVPKTLKDVIGRISWKDAATGNDQTLQQVFRALTGRATPSQQQLNQGLPNILGLGIRVHSFYLKEVKVNDTIAQQNKEREAQGIKRKGQLEEIEGVVEQVEKLTSIDGVQISGDKALDTVSVRAGEVEKIIIDIQGLGGGGSGLNSMSISALLTQLLIDAGVSAKKAINMVTSRASEIERFVAEVQGSGGSQGGSGLSMVGLAGLLNTLGISPQGLAGKKGGGQRQPKKGGKKGGPASRRDVDKAIDEVGKQKK